MKIAVAIVAALIVSYVLMAILFALDVNDLSTGQAAGWMSALTFLGVQEYWDDIKG